MLKGEEEERLSAWLFQTCWFGMMTHKHKGHWLTLFMVDEPAFSCSGGRDIHSREEDVPAFLNEPSCDAEGL